MQRPRSGRAPIAVVLVGLVFASLVLARDTAAERSLLDYRYFRALSIDLLGRPPTRAELLDYERPTFDLDAWLDTKLATPTYAERIRRVYTDLLRLEVPPAIQFRPPSIMLRWTKIQDDSGAWIDLYFRDGQRRARAEIDGQVCFTQAEVGVQIGYDGPPVGTPKRVSRKLLDERTVLVKPWWLYADHRAAQPRLRAGDDWRTRFPGLDVVWSMFVAPDGKTPQQAIRVCREEAQRAETGRIHVTGRTPSKADALLPGRLTRLPGDTAFAKANPGRAVSCLSQTGFESSIECGCGVGLERCVPLWPNAFVQPYAAPLGIDQPFFASPRPYLMWLQTWFSEEPRRFLDRVFADDRDVREMLTSPRTVINGPLAQFYRFFAGATCCGRGTDLGYERAESLFDPAAVPTDLAPQDVSDWVEVPDRGEHAAGLMTMPVFLVKYATRRQRAHAIYRTFMCRDFVAENVRLAPSDEPDLTKRPGCASCHMTLEPMAAYFARVQESDWTYLPDKTFPLVSDRCKGAEAGRGACATYFDATFSDRDRPTLRGTYVAPHHANAGPAGFAASVTSSPEFAPCVVRNVAQSLLGRSLTPGDDAWAAELASEFVTGGYRMRALVRAILTSPAYRNANDVIRRSE